MYYTVSQASVLLGVHTQTIRRWDREGKIRVSSWSETLYGCGDHIRPSDGHNPDDEGMTIKHEER